MIIIFLELKKPNSYMKENIRFLTLNLTSRIGDFILTQEKITPLSI